MPVLEEQVWQKTYELDAARDPALAPLKPAAQPLTAVPLDIPYAVSFVETFIKLRTIRYSIELTRAFGRRAAQRSTNKGIVVIHESLSRHRQWKFVGAGYGKTLLARRGLMEQGDDHVCILRVR